MSKVIRPEGWFDWKKPEAHQTARYAEFNSTGPGGSPKQRVDWAKQLTKAAAAAITPGKVLGGSDNWNPVTSR
jgi:pectinesterase